MEIDFEFVFESAPDAVLIVSEQGRIVRINAEAERMFGYSRQELLGQPLEILLPERLRAAHARSREKCAWSPCSRPMGASDRDFRARHRDGGEFFVDVSLSPTNAGGVIAMARDVSERKRMNQELAELTAKLERNAADLGRQSSILESILNSMGEGVIVCDRSGKLLLVNTAALRLHPALRSRDDPLVWISVAAEFGLYLPDRVTPYPPDELPLARVLKGELVDGLEIFVRAPRAPEGIWTTVAARPLLDGEGNIAAGVVVIRDTSALKFAQVALLAGQEAEDSRIARELHDSACQNLCGLILDMVQLQQELPASFGHVRNRIRSQEEKLRALAEELACVCRQLHPSFLERIGLNLALEQLCQEFTERKGLHTSYLLADAPASLPEAQALCLYRVAQEALRNILRHARVTHATVRLSEAGGSLQLSIEDEGAGFDPKNKNMEGKAGLGLVSMQERVRLAGGSISIHSEPGHGTRIHVRVPLLDGSQRQESSDTFLATVAAP